MLNLNDLLHLVNGVTGTSVQKIRDMKKQEMLLNQRFLFFFLQKYSSGTFVQKIALGFKTRTF